MAVREVASGLRFPEGPVAMEDGSVLVVELAALPFVQVHDAFLGIWRNG